MSKHSKRMLLCVAVALIVIAAGVADFYRQIRPTAKQVHLDRIQDDTSELPELARQMPFDGSVEYVQYHGYSLRPPRYLIASHIRLPQLKEFCDLHGLSLDPADFPIPETPPDSWRIVAEFKLDPKLFSFHCEDKIITVVNGHTAGTPSWLVHADYCPSSGLIVMELVELGDK